MRDKALSLRRRCLALIDDLLQLLTSGKDLESASIQAKVEALSTKHAFSEDEDQFFDNFPSMLGIAAPDSPEETRQVLEAVRAFLLGSGHEALAALDAASKEVSIP